MEKHHSCLNTRVIIEYFQDHHPDLLTPLLENLHPEIDILDRPREFLTDINNWVSSDVVVRLFEKARRLSGDERIAFKIGQYAVTHQRFGYVQRIITRAFGTPRRALARLQAISDKFNRNKVLEVVFRGRRQALVRYKYFRHLPHSPDFCLFNQGILTAMQGFWGLPAGRLVENRCFFKGDDYCEYLCEWDEPHLFRRWLKRIFLPWRLLQETILELEQDKEALKRKYDEVHHLNLQLKEKMGQLLSLPQACITALTTIDLKGLVQITLNFFLRLAKFDRALLFLLDEATERLELVGAVGLEGSLLDQLQALGSSGLEAAELLALSQEVMEPLLVVEEPAASALSQHPLLAILHPRMVLVAPIAGRTGKIGVIYADRQRPAGTAVEIDRDLILNFLHQLALALDSALSQRRLAMSERRYRDLVENAYEGIGLLDAEGRIKYANPRLTELLQEPQPGGRELRSFFGGDSRKLISTMLALNRQGQVAQRELTLTGKGKTAIVIASSVPIFEDKRYVGSYTILHEVTRLKQVEQRLLQQQKMAALATLTEGWARSLNQILNNIMILTSLLLADADPAQGAYGDLKQIEQEVQKGVELVERLQSLGRVQFQPRAADLNLLLDKVVKLCRFTHKHLRFRLELAPELPPACMDVAQIEPVLIRVLHWIKADTDRPQEVIISTELVHLSEDFCQLHQRLPGPYLYLALQAPGWQPLNEIQDLIFTPFVTGMAPGSGQLGDLSSIYSIIKNHQGIIEADQSARDGFALHLYLPVAKERATEPAKPSSQFVRGSGTILLVDDDDQVRSLGRRLLQRLGYQVIPAASGQEALEAVRTHPGQIDLVVLDLIFPDISGREVFYQLRQADPNLKILIYSAHSLDEEVHQMLERGAIGFLQKPYRLAALSQKIAALLGLPAQPPPTQAAVEP